MAESLFDNFDRKGIIHSYDPNISVPDQFMDFIDKYGETTYRSTFLINFDAFKPYQYFLVLFVEKGTKGKINSWAIVDRKKCLRVKSKSDSSSFYNAKFGLKGNKYSKFKSLFSIVAMGRFNTEYTSTDFNLLKTEKPLKSLTSLQTALYIEVPQKLITELEGYVK